MGLWSCFAGRYQLWTAGIGPLIGSDHPCMDQAGQAGFLASDLCVYGRPPPKTGGTPRAGHYWADLEDRPEKVGLGITRVSLVKE